MGKWVSCLHLWRCSVWMLGTLGVWQRRLELPACELGIVVKWDHTLSSVRAASALKDVWIYKALLLLIVILTFVETVTCYDMEPHTKIKPAPTWAFSSLTLCDTNCTSLDVTYQDSGSPREGPTNAVQSEDKNCFFIDMDLVLFPLFFCTDIEVDIWFPCERVSNCKASLVCA